MWTCKCGRPPLGTINAGVSQRRRLPSQPLKSQGSTAACQKTFTTRQILQRKGTPFLRSGRLVLEGFALNRSTSRRGFSEIANWNAFCIAMFSASDAKAESHFSAFGANHRIVGAIARVLVEMSEPARDATPIERQCPDLDIAHWDRSVGARADRKRIGISKARHGIPRDLT